MNHRTLSGAMYMADTLIVFPVIHISIVSNPGLTYKTAIVLEVRVCFIVFDQCWSFQGTFLYLSDLQYSMSFVTGKLLSQ